MRMKDLMINEVERFQSNTRILHNNQIILF